MVFTKKRNTRGGTRSEPPGRRADAPVFVLVHGMSHGAWAWELVAPVLEERGYRVVTMDLPGHGRRAHERARASIDAYGRAVADEMISAGVTRAVLVGHSMGGIVIQRAAELVPERIAHLVFLAAVVLPPGGSLLGTHLPPASRTLFRGLAIAGGGVVQYSAAMEHARWFGDMAPGDPRVVAALTRLTPQPLRPWVERVDFRQFWAGDLPRSYIRCLRDAAIVPAAAVTHARRLGVDPIDIDTAHAPMLSAPAELATILEKIAYL
jgi:pimeloyl-ACP methyl ester carboxylesterase